MYVWEALGAGWNLEAKVFAAAGTTGDYFGRSITGAGERLVVGAPGDDRAANGTGTSYVFERAGASWSELASLNASSPVQNARLGRSIALLGERVFVGAPDPNRRGRVLEFGSESATWSEQEVFTAGPGPAPGHRFGEALAADGVTLVVGLQGEDTLGTDSGAVYVFDVNDFYPKLAFREASLPDPADMISSTGDEFGTSVAVSGSTAIVGAPGAPNGGAAFIFERSQGAWSPAVQLSPSPLTGADPRFGVSVDIDGNTAIVGVPGFVSPAGQQGAIFVFVRIGSTWLQAARLLSPEPNLQFLGTRVALRNGIAVGTGNSAWTQVFRGSGTAWTADAVLFSPNTLNVSTDGVRIATIQQSGFQNSVLVYRRTSSGWSIASLTQVTSFLRSISLDGDRFAVGTPNGANGRVRVYEGASGGSTQLIFDFRNSDIFDFGRSVTLRGGALVVGGTGDSGSASGPGRAQVFFDVGGTWQLTQELLPPLPHDGDRFGLGTALGDGFALVGMPRRSFEEGRFHAFLVGPPPAAYCTGKTNSLGCVPFLAAAWLPSSSSSAAFDVRAYDVIPGAPGSLMYGFQSDASDFHGGKLCVKAPFQTLSPATTATALGAQPCIGVLSLDFNAHIRSGADPLLTVGQSVFLQWTQQDAGDPAGFGDSLTNGLSMSICP